MDTLKIRVIMEYEYRRGSKAAQAARNINDVYGANTTNERTTRYWFARFRSGNFDLKNEPRGRPKTLVDNDELKAIVEADDTQSTAELAAAFDVSIKTILVHLRQIGKVKKLDKWVPHELNDRQREVRVETCLALLNRHTNEGILNRIVTCDEKWILFDNRKRSASWLDPGSAPKQCPKRKLTPRKVMVTVWWSNAGVIHHSFLPNGTSITADVYCEELNTMMEKLARLQPALVNRSAPLLLHDNARPHTAQQTVSKLQELGLEVLRHPPYSPDLAPTDFYFSRIWITSWREKNSIPERQYKMPLKNLLPPVQLISSRRASISYQCVGKDALIAWVITLINRSKKYRKKNTLNLFHEKRQFHR